MNQRFASWGAPLFVVILMIVVWEFICIALQVPEFVLPRPSRIAVVLVENIQPIWFHARQTLFTTLLGFVLAVIVGMLLGILVGSSRLAYLGLYPVLIGFNSVPKVAVVPVLVVWFGIGTVPAVLTAFLLSFFPIAVNVATGLATVEPELRDVLRSLGATELDIVRKVGIPRSLPYFFASLKIAITLSFVGSVIAETLASNVGIGTLMTQAAANFRIPLVFAALVVVAAMGVAMYAVFAAIERRTIGWAVRATVDFGAGG
jgi:NitT/TauT family transport system permease protein